MMTAAFVSLTHLNLDTSVSGFVESCIAANAPTSFKLAAVQGYRERQKWDHEPAGKR
ncbi:hypothetical protein FGSG_13935, partial [Fusarium graminearum PH-1]|uniref:hypothetical protein n=1 Tax=Gibberella zeae (strain ATCC MYA-4620 / CBS 123657 / FGSC 9075 / NRRL 31084 / PH-1) TaxID=229533 RepID=UPI00021F182B